MLCVKNMLQSTQLVKSGRLTRRCSSSICFADVSVWYKNTLYFDHFLNTEFEKGASHWVSRLLQQGSVTGFSWAWVACLNHYDGAISNFYFLNLLYYSIGILSYGNSVFSCYLQCPTSRTRVGCSMFRRSQPLPWVSGKPLAVILFTCGERHAFHDTNCNSHSPYVT